MFENLKLLGPLLLIVVSIGLIQENLVATIPELSGGFGLFVGIVLLGIGIYFGFMRNRGAS